MIFTFLLLLSPHSNASVVTPNPPVYRSVLSEEWSFRERIPRAAFSAIKPGRTRPKFRPLHGSYEDPIDVYFESIEPFLRIDVLRKLSSYPTYWTLHTATPDSHVPEQLSDYMKFLVGNAYMEVGILRYLLGIVFSSETDQISAVQIANKIQSEMFVHPLNFVTPRIILDWIDLICDAGRFRIQINHEHLRLDNPNDIPSDTLLNLELRAWQDMLSSRLNKLTLTGYENIDL